ncbi:MAG: hypothetical protein EZS28_017294 [Streblomastix strix]|uniref:Uncharacterized protein n=1 Tax=Streblomastix strix TaxID=222440 RepID=A0A5J4VXD7_9EUKA|nr:MAG: hypothetical protein EZS28_017294 [Streblomastix strix]
MSKFRLKKDIIKELEEKQQHIDQLENFNKERVNIILDIEEKSPNSVKTSIRAAAVYGMTFAEFNKVAPDRTTHSEYKSSVRRNDMNDYRPIRPLYPNPRSIQKNQLFILAVTIENPAIALFHKLHLTTSGSRAEELLFDKTKEKLDPELKEMKRRRMDEMIRRQQKVKRQRQDMDEDSSQEGIRNDQTELQLLLGEELSNDPEKREKKELNKNQIEQNGKKTTKVLQQ